MKGIVTVVALGGAALLVYQYLKQQGMLGGAPAKPAEEAEKPAAEKAPAKPADFVTLTRDQLFQYAQQQKGAGWDGRLTISEWHWMVSKLSGINQESILPGGDSPIYAEEYLAFRKTAGISGMGYLMPVGWA